MDSGQLRRTEVPMSGFDLDDVPNWRGRDVVDQNGHAVGVITDLYVDDATGVPSGPWSRAGSSATT
jgi:hypothetical protein